VDFWDYSTTERHLRVNLRLRNESTVLLRVLNGHTWIQLMQPWPEIEIEKFKELAKDPAKTPYEVVWPFPAQGELERLHNKERELEPGECDEVAMDFFINKEYSRVLVYTFIENRKKPGRNIGWTASSIVDFAKPEGEITEHGRGQNLDKARPESRAK
jgi:hypothetical protein